MPAGALLKSKVALFCFRCKATYRERPNLKQALSYDRQLYPLQRSRLQKVEREHFVDN